MADFNKALWKKVVKGKYMTGGGFVRFFSLEKHD